MTATDDDAGRQGTRTPVPTRRAGDVPAAEERPAWLRWSVAMLAFTVAYLGTLYTWPLFQPSVFLLFFGAVAVSAWFCGRWPAVAVIALAALAVMFHFYEPYGTFSVSDPAALVRLCGFLVIASLITALSDELRERRRSLEVALATVGTLNAQLRDRAETSEAQAAKLGTQAAALEEQAAELEEQAAELEMQAAELEIQLERVQELNVQLETTTQAESDARAHAESASRAKSEFLAVMSHELRTPLNAIIGYGELLSGGVVGGLSERQKEHVGRIHVAAWQLLGLIEQILNLSRIESGQEQIELEEVDLGALLHESIDLIRPLADERRLQIVARLPELPELLRTDPGKVRQIAINLLANACKFTERGEVRVGVESAAESLSFTVADTGIGIPRDQLERVFEPFVQADATPGMRRGGTGLGLAVSRRLARLLGGDLTVMSEPGKGSTFTVSLPRQPDA